MQGNFSRYASLLSNYCWFIIKGDLFGSFKDAHPSIPTEEVFKYDEYTEKYGENGNWWMRNVGRQKKKKTIAGVSTFFYIQIIDIVK